MGGNYCAPPPSISVIAPIFSHPAAKPQTEARYRVSLLYNWGSAETSLGAAGMSACATGLVQGETRLRGQIR
jgi:hypothetical protein